jgi:hypothetical protein
VAQIPKTKKEMGEKNNGAEALKDDVVLPFSFFFNPSGRASA